MGLIWNTSRGTIYPGEIQPTEPPDDVAVGHCGFCHDEIYAGETIYCIDGKRIHEDCLGYFARDYFANCKEET